MKRKLGLLTILAMALPVVMAGPTDAAQLNGTVSLEDYYSGDTASGSRHAMTGRLRFDLTKIGSSEKFAFHFDARHRLDLSGESSTSSKEGRIDQAQLEYAGTSLYLSIGRLWPKDMPIEVVDSVNAFYHGSKTGVGVYAGLRGVPEDPVCGSGNGSVAALIRQHGILDVSAYKAALRGVVSAETAWLKWNFHPMVRFG